MARRIRVASYGSYFPMLVPRRRVNRFRERNRPQPPPRTSNYPGHPIFPIHQSYGRVAYVNAISDAIFPPAAKKPVKRQLYLHVSLKNKKNVFFFAMQVSLCTIIISLLGLSPL